MRTTPDRIRQALSFEVIGLFVVISFGTLVLGYSMVDFGLLGAIGATIATVWNYIYNLMFDHTLLKYTGTPKKSVRLRVVHAFGFELGLMVVFLPIVTRILDVSLMEALIIDLGFIAFYLVYAFVFTWAYDTIFPISQPFHKTEAEFK
ncbi:MAG: PACE efflux transporter [Marinobacter sp.]